jgi:hypothetical protein
MSSDIKEKAIPMEFNKLSISLISILITLAVTLGSFAYKTGVYNNEVKNLKEQQIVIKTDLTDQMNRMELRKADVDVVELIFKKIESMDSKLDTLILQRVGDK